MLQRAGGVLRRRWRCWSVGVSPPPTRAPPPPQALRWRQWWHFFGNKFQKRGGRKGWRGRFSSGPSRRQSMTSKKRDHDEEEGKRKMKEKRKGRAQSQKGGERRRSDIVRKELFYSSVLVRASVSWGTLGRQHRQTYANWSSVGR